jgi:ABC-type transport system substrate-binding protein
MDPITGTGGDEHQFLWSVYDNLVRNDQSLTPTKSRSLAENWETPDKTTLVFNLRKGVTFHDGSAFNADELKWHLERARDLEGAVTAQDLGYLENVETIDDYTTKVTLSQPFAPLLRMLGDRPGMVVSRKQVEATDQFQGRNPVGTGAFAFVEELEGDRVVLKANDNYWMEGAPKVDGLVYQFGVDSDQKVNAMLSGDLDIVDNPDPNQLETLEAAGITVAKQPTNAKIRTWLNMNMEPWTNVHLRRALNYAVDRDELNNLVYGGLHTPATTGFFGPALGDTDYDPDFVGFNFDPQRVAAELSLAGYPDGFEYDVNTSNAPLNLAKDELIQAQYAKLGIKRNIIPKVSPDYYMEFWEEQIGAHSSGMSVRPDVWQQIAYIVNANGKSSGVLPGPDDEFRKAIDAAMSAVGEAYDPEDRKKAMSQLNQAYVDSAWGVDYLNSTYTVAMQKNITYTPSAIGKFYFGNGDIAIS